MMWSSTSSSSSWPSSLASSSIIILVEEDDTRNTINTEILQYQYYVVVTVCIHAGSSNDVGDGEQKNRETRTRTTTIHTFLDEEFDSIYHTPNRSMVWYGMVWYGTRLLVQIFIPQWSVPYVWLERYGYGSIVVPKKGNRRKPQNQTAYSWLAGGGAPKKGRQTHNTQYTIHTTVVSTQTHHTHQIDDEIDWHTSMTRRLQLRLQLRL